MDIDINQFDEIKVAIEQLCDDILNSDIAEEGKLADKINSVKNAISNINNATGKNITNAIKNAKKKKEDLKNDQTTADLKNKKKELEEIKQHYSNIHKDNVKKLQELGERKGNSKEEIKQMIKQQKKSYKDALSTEVKNKKVEINEAKEKRDDKKAKIREKNQTDNKKTSDQITTDATKKAKEIDKKFSEEIAARETKIQSFNVKTGDDYETELKNFHNKSAATLLKLKTARLKWISDIPKAKTQEQIETKVKYALANLDTLVTELDKYLNQVEYYQNLKSTYKTKAKVAVRNKKYLEKYRRATEALNEYRKGIEPMLTREEIKAMESITSSMIDILSHMSNLVDEDNEEYASEAVTNSKLPTEKKKNKYLRLIQEANKSESEMVRSIAPVLDEMMKIAIVNPITKQKWKAAVRKYKNACKSIYVKSKSNVKEWNDISDSKAQKLKNSAKAAIATFDLKGNRFIQKEEKDVYTEDEVFEMMQDLLHYANTNAKYDKMISSKIDAKQKAEESLLREDCAEISLEEFLSQMNQDLGSSMESYTNGFSFDDVLESMRHVEPLDEDEIDYISTAIESLNSIVNSINGEFEDDSEEDEEESIESDENDEVDNNSEVEEGEEVEETSVTTAENDVVDAYVESAEEAFADIKNAIATTVSNASTNFKNYFSKYDSPIDFIKDILDKFIGWMTTLLNQAKGKRVSKTVANELVRVLKEFISDLLSIKSGKITESSISKIVDAENVTYKAIVDFMKSRTDLYDNSDPSKLAQLVVDEDDIMSASEAAKYETMMRKFLSEIKAIKKQIASGAGIEVDNPELLNTFAEGLNKVLCLVSKLMTSVYVDNKSRMFLPNKIPQTASVAV